FKILHGRGKVEIMVFYTWGEQSQEKHDPGFGVTVAWDVPLLEGYPYTWVNNTAYDPGTHHYMGIVTPQLTRQIMDWRPDAVLVFGWAWQSHLAVMRFLKGKLPVYFRGDSTLLTEASGFRKFLRSVFLRWVYRHVDHAFYVGKNNYSYFRKFGLADHELTFAPHAVDNERFMSKRDDEASALRSGLGLTRDDVLVLFAGKFENVKNVTLLLESFIELDDPHLHLLLAGAGPDEAELNSMAATYPHRVHLMGFQNQSYMPVLYQACDVFCLPSRSETWGLSVNEAMACGKAVLVSDKVGCTADLVENGFNGFVFESENKKALRECLERIGRSKQSLHTMGSRSAGIISDWSFTRIALAIENTLNEKKRSD
ncbi:MAG: glycosyltransferase family 4 protein, partial [Bacteroidetes bacterium]|nr:glycosyltransferase family 4 protein [Bacteroidota bacterium]